MGKFGVGQWRCPWCGGGGGGGGGGGQGSMDGIRCTKKFGGGRSEKHCCRGQSKSDTAI